jgi:hypothetical protein
MSRRRQKTDGNGQEEQETDGNEQEEAGDRQEWTRGGRRQTGMSRRRQETDRNGEEETGDSLGRNRQDKH